jgi:hypothetical protein
MNAITRRSTAAVFAGALLFGAAACGDDDSGVDVDVDEEQVEDNHNDAGDSIKEGADELEDTVDENVDIGDDAEGDDDAGE